MNSIFTFVGPRGSGKTTKLKSIAKQLSFEHPNYKIDWLAPTYMMAMDAKKDIVEENINHINKVTSSSIRFNNNSEIVFRVPKPGHVKGYSPNAVLIDEAGHVDLELVETQYAFTRATFYMTETVNAHSA